MSRHPLKSPSQRQLRVGEEMRHALAKILERGELRDPDLGGRPITVTEVDVSPDLKNARVFVTPLGGGDSAEVVAALMRARGYLRRVLSERVRLRYMPELSFRPDRSFGRADEIAQLLRDPLIVRDLAPREGSPEPGDGDG